jgi:hypothetical protein
MIKKIAVLLFVFYSSVSYAQTIKTDVLVVGGGVSGVAAAIQCARSKVKTLLIEKSSALCPGMVNVTMNTIKTDHNLPSGLWGEFRKRVIAHYKKIPGYDTLYNAPLQLQADTGTAILTGMADTIKNLSIKLNTQFISIKKDDDRWDVTITQNGKTQLIKARVVIDATTNGDVAQKARATFIPFNILENTSKSKIYRTSIAMGDELPKRYDDTALRINNYPPFPTYGIPIKAFVAKGVDNLLLTDKILPDNGDINYLPSQLTLGQGTGVIAAYCAFFKTTTAHLNVRMIQGELLDFKGYILPLPDISGDPYWRAIQQVCATGMLKGVQSVNENDDYAPLLFMPDSIVTTAEAKPVLLETYTRAFLWFSKEKPGTQLTIGNLLSFISELTLTDPQNVQIKISRDWKTKYHFKSDFDMSRPITRREFAILANQYLNPFARTVDLNGNMVN